MTDEGRERWVLRALGIATGLLVLLVLLAIGGGQLAGVAAATGLGLAILVASFEMGALLGFVFSLPRVLARSEPPSGAPVTERRALMSTNTNLERISDWLTTLLVGAGLTQLARVPEALTGFSAFVAGAMPPGSAGSAILATMAPVILVAGAVLGFLVMYLYTRIEITRVLTDVEHSLDRSEQRMLKGAALSMVGSADEGATPLAVTMAAAGNGTPEDAIDLMFDLLYRPEGYLRAIAIGEQLRNSPATAKADYWFYLAAAYGQQLRELLAAGDRTGAVDARAKALAAARQAVRIKATYASRLWSISVPGSLDDDLSALRDDPEFRKIVGRAAEGGEPA